MFLLVVLGSIKEMLCLLIYVYVFWYIKFYSPDPLNFQRYQQIRNQKRLI